jgi:NADH-quinone oxidoreductase subunit L
VDEIYNALIVRPVFWVAKSFIVAVTDGRIIEGIVNGIPRSIGRTSELIRKMQTGLVHHYAAVMGLGLLAVIAIAFMW